MRWMNAPTSAARRFSRSDTPARQAEPRGDALPDLRRGDVARPLDPEPGANRGSARQIDDAATAANPGPIDLPDPAPRPGLLRLRHVDRA